MMFQLYLESKNNFCEKILKHREMDQRVLVFSDKRVDLAAELRYICRVPVFVTYKDGGITLSDGALGKKWNDKWKISSGSVEIGLKELDRQISLGDFSHVVFKTVNNVCSPIFNSNFYLSARNNNYCMYQYKSLTSNKYKRQKDD